MKLKRKITQAELDQLSKELQELYTKVGDEFVLDLDDTAFETLKAEKANLKKELDDYKAQEEERIRKAEERAKKKAQEEYDKAKNDKDVEAVEKSWQEKYSKLETTLNETTAKHNAYVRSTLIDKAVKDMADEISTSPALIAPHIRSRLDVDMTGEQPKLFVLGDNGERSALTLDELKKSFVDNKDFSAIIKATSANGGAKAGRFVSGTQDEEKPVRLGQLSDQELAEYASFKYGQTNQ